MTKVLIIRFSSIGDVVLTTPVVRNLKNQLDGSVEIHYLTKTKFRTLVEPNPHISKVYSIEKSTNEVIEALQSEAYDYVVDLHKNLRSARVKRALKALDFTFEKLNWEKWLLVNFGIDRLPRIHIVDRYMDAVSAFGIENDDKGLDYFIAESDYLESVDIPESHRSGFIAVGIGAAHWRKKLRIHQYVDLCKRLNYPVSLIGGPAERDDGDEIAQKSGAQVWNTAGKLRLGQTASLLKISKLVITPDTGIMHIAAAFKKPIISIWGATVPEFGMYPYHNEALNKMVEASHLKKRPCSKLGTKCKYKPCKCIDELPLDEVLSAAKIEIAPSTR